MSITKHIDFFETEYGLVGSNELDQENFNLVRRSRTRKDGQPDLRFKGVKAAWNFLMDEAREIARIRWEAEYDG